MVLTHFHRNQGTGHRQGSNSASTHLPSSPCRSQLLLPSLYLTHTQAQGWSDSCRRRSSHSLSTASAGRVSTQLEMASMASPDAALKGQQRLRRHPLPHHTMVFSSETSPFHLLLCGFTGLPVLKLATLPCPALETLHSEFSFPISSFSFYPFCWPSSSSCVSYGHRKGCGKAHFWGNGYLS